MQYADALSILSDVAKKMSLPREQISFSDSLGRRASSDVMSQMTIPPYHNSGVDGYCFDSKISEGATGSSPVRLSIIGTIFPGDLPPEFTPPGSAWEIMTGAPFPLDCDCAVKVEDTQAVKSATGQVTSITLKSKTSKGENLRAAGADFSPDDVIVERGEKIRPEHLMALAANGVTEVSVFKKPRVVIIPTGAELVSVGTDLKPGQIFNSTQPYLIAALSALGCAVEAKPIVHDDPAAFLEIMKDLEKDPPELIVTTGAVSMGKADFIRPSLEKIGAEILFHRVDIRPGRPILFSRLKSNSKIGAFFGLPGNPVSSVVGVRFFIEPFLRSLIGIAPEKPQAARLQKSYKKPGSLRCFLKAKSHSADGQTTLEVLSGQPSFMTKPLLQASSWAMIPEGLEEISAGSMIDVFPQTSEF